MKNLISKRLISLHITLFNFLFLLSPSFASDALKIGAINLQTIVDESDAGEKANTELNTLAKSKQSVIDEKRKLIEKQRIELEKQRSVLSADAIKIKQDEIEKMERDLFRFGQDAEVELRKKDSELQKLILQEIFEIAQKIAVEENYTIIFDKGLLIYSDKAIDITEKFIKKYDELKNKKKK